MSAQLGSLPAFLDLERRSRRRCRHPGRLHRRQRRRRRRPRADRTRWPPPSVTVASSTSRASRPPVAVGVGNGYRRRPGAYRRQPATRSPTPAATTRNRIAGSPYLVGFTSAAANGGNGRRQCGQRLGRPRRQRLADPGRPARALLIRIFVNNGVRCPVGGFERVRISSSATFWSTPTSMQRRTARSSPASRPTCRAASSITAFDDNDVTSNVSTATRRPRRLRRRRRQQPRRQRRQCASPRRPATSAATAPRLRRRTPAGRARRSRPSPAGSRTAAMGGISTGTQGSAQGPRHRHGGAPRSAGQFLRPGPGHEGRDRPRRWAAAARSRPATATTRSSRRSAMAALRPWSGGTGGHRRVGSLPGERRRRRQRQPDAAPRSSTRRILVDSFTDSTTAGGKRRHRLFGRQPGRRAYRARADRPRRHRLRERRYAGGCRHAGREHHRKPQPDGARRQCRQRDDHAGHRGRGLRPRGTFGTVLAGSFDYIDQNVTVNAGAALSGAGQMRSSSRRRS